MSEVIIKKSEYLSMKEQIKEYIKIIQEKDKKISEFRAKYFEQVEKIRNMTHKPALPKIQPKNLKP